MPCPPGEILLIFDQSVLSGGKKKEGTEYPDIASELEKIDECSQKLS